MNASISTDLTWASRGFLQPSHVQNGAPSTDAENDAMPDLVDSDHSDSDSDQHDTCVAQDAVETSRPSQVSKLSFIPQVPQKSLVVSFDFPRRAFQRKLENGDQSFGEFAKFQGMSINNEPVFFSGMNVPKDV
jgi:hypothetical protein